MKTTMLEMKNTLVRIDGKLDTAEEDTVHSNTQQQKLSKMKYTVRWAGGGDFYEQRISELSYETTSTGPTYV